MGSPSGRINAVPPVVPMTEAGTGLLVDREITERNNRRLKTRLRQAKLKQTACMEDIDYRQPRGLDKSLTLRLADCHWVKERLKALLCLV